MYAVHFHLYPLSLYYKMITSTSTEVSLVEKPFTCITIWYALHIPFSFTFWFLMDQSTNPCMTHWCRLALLVLSFSLKVSPNSRGCGLYFMKASIYFFVLKREWSIRVLSWWDKWYKIRQFCYWRSLLIMYHRFTWLSTLWESFSFPVKIIYQDTLF